MRLQLNAKVGTAKRYRVQLCRIVATVCRIEYRVRGQCTQPPESVQNIIKVSIVWNAAHYFTLL